MINIPNVMPLIKVKSKLFWGIFLFTLHLSSSFAATNNSHNQNVIHVALNSSATIRAAFLPLFKAFEEETGIAVKITRFTDDNEFDRFMEKWIVQGIDTPDVLYGHNSERLLSLAQKGYVHPITTLWQQHGWHNDFRQELIDWVSYQGEIYGLPYNYYTWGYFYKNNLVERFGPVPDTWQEFLDYCQRLKDAGITPFPASQEQPWIASAWFEYFVLRMHGLAMFKEIVAGNVSFYQPEVQTVFSTWQEMINKGYFSQSYTHYRWEEYLPHFLRDELGFVFMSTNLGSRIFDDKTIENVEFMGFPKISDIPRNETAPSNVFFIPNNCPDKEKAKIFLRFFAQPDIQSQLAHYSYSSPAHIRGTSSSGKYALAGHESLATASGISPFFDRAVKAGFEKVSVNAFAKFLQNGDVNHLTETLESARLQYYK